MSVLSLYSGTMPAVCQLYLFTTIYYIFIIMVCEYTTLLLDMTYSTLDGARPK